MNTSRLQTIERYAKEQAESYAVIVDGNRHQLPVRVRTTREAITLAKCQSIVDRVESQFGIKVQKIEINLSQYDYSEIKTEADAVDAMFGEVSPTRTLNKQAVYYADSKCLQIWQDGMPIYENNDGAICRDRDALADCLC